MAPTKPEKLTVMLPPSAELQTSTRSDAIRREMRIQQTELAAYAQWMMYPLTLQVSLMLWPRLRDTGPLLAWAGIALLQVIISQFNFRRDRRLQQANLVDPHYWLRNFCNSVSYGLCWGYLPLLAAQWGDRESVWLALLINIALASALVMVHSTSRRFFLSALLPMMALTLLAIGVGGLPWRSLLPLMFIFVAGLVLLHRLMQRQQLERVRAILQGREQAAELAYTLQNHDPLTGLFNRQGLKNWLDQQSNQPRPPSRLILLMGVVKGIGDINALYGSEAGDRLIRDVANRLVQHGSGRFGIARLSGAEFALLDARPSPELAALQQVAATVERQPFQLGSQPLGVALHTAWSEGTLNDIDTMLEGIRARLGEGTAGNESAVNVPLAAQRRELLQDIARAIETREMQPWFQPVLDCRTHEILSWEALTRWHHPRFGVLTPDQFIDIVRLSNLSLALAQQVLAGAIEFIHDLQNQGEHACARVGLNFTAPMLAEKDMLAWFAARLDGTGVHPSQLTLEISEQEALGLSEQFRTNLLQLQELGVQLAIDDFGTGYANLGHLIDLPASTVKLDKRFIEQLPLDKDSSALVRAVLTLASGLGMKTVAEGVENDEQLAFLCRNGCDAYQGFLSSGALPKAAALDFVQRWRQRSTLPHTA